jgi:hypothetical protein
MTAISVANELAVDKTRPGYYGYRAKDSNKKLFDAAKLREREGNLYCVTDLARAKKILSSVTFLHDAPIDIPDVWSFNAKEYERFL